MTTLDQARSALAEAHAQLSANVLLIERALPLLRDVESLIAAGGSDVLRELSDDEALAVRAAVVYVLNVKQVGLAERAVVTAVAETN